MMIEWSKILTSENFYSDPDPHFRIFNVLPEDVHSKLYSTYFDVMDQMHQPLGSHARAQNVSNAYWNELLDDMWNSTAVLHTHWQNFTHRDLSGEHACLLVNFSCHNQTAHPGQIIKDWHLDGPDKKLSYIYYLGVGDETHGNFEISNKERTSTKDYPYQANSMTIWYNHEKSLHRFRQANKPRMTVYVAFT